MSFNFGNNPASTQGSGFLFGSSTAGGGFSFGQKPSSGFSFGNTSSNSAPQTGFSLGNTVSVAPQQQSSGTPFGFGSTSAQTAKPSFGFGSAAAATTTTQGLGFGSSSSTQAAGFTFGSTKTVQPSGFGLGTISSASNAIPSATTGFGFSSKPASNVNPASGLTFNVSKQNSLTATSTNPTATIANPTPGFSFVTKTQSTALNFGTPSVTKSSFGFGSSTVSSQPSSATTGLTFGSTVNQTIGQSAGFSVNPSTTSSFFSFNKTTSSNPPTTASTLSGLLTGQKTTSVASDSAPIKPVFQLSTSSIATSSSASFQLPSFKLAASTTATLTQSTGFQVSSSTSGSTKEAPASTALVPSAGKFSLYQPVSSAPTAKTQSGGFSQSVPSTATTPATGFNLSTPATVGSSAPTTQSVSTSSTPGGFSFGTSIPNTTSASNVTSTVASTAKPTGMFNFKQTTTASSTTAATTLGSNLLTTTSAAPTPTLKYKELETKINKWRDELEQQEHLFITQATQVNAWNKLLIDNSEKITTLNEEFEKVSCDQERLNQELDFIKTQQDELENLLTPLEESTKKQVSSMTSSVHTHHADVERERTYNLAETIDCQLKRMAQDLREVIDHVNSTTSSGEIANPVSQISKILSAHMDSLQWLDTNSVALQQKLDQLTKQVNDRKLEQESRLRLAFD